MSFKNLKKAATLIINAGVKNGVKGEFDYKVMLLKRTSQMRAAPGFHVFPGGKYDEPSEECHKWLQVFFSASQIDKMKSKPSLINEHFKGCVNNFTLGRLVEREATGELRLPLEISFRLCAIRETFEETGLLLAKRKKRDASSSYEQADLYVSHLPMERSESSKWRKRLEKSSAEFVNMCLELDLVPDVMALHEWANWITPVIEKFRFNTFFFTCFLPSLPPDKLIDINQNEIECLQVFSSLQNLLKSYH